MGKMKELYIAEQEKLAYEASLDSYTEFFFNSGAEKFVIVCNTPCPNCNEFALLRTESEASCKTCGQAYIYVNKALRFK
jgi:hypothetical protein